MHAYRKFLEDQLEAHNMSPAEFSRASGLSEQRISQLRNDKRERIAQAPDEATIKAIAKGFTVKPEVVWMAVAEAMGLPRFVVPSITHEVKDAPNEQLVKELARRLGVEVSVRKPRSAKGKNQKIDPQSGLPATDGIPVPLADPATPPLAGGSGT